MVMDGLTDAFFVSLLRDKKSQRIWKDADTETSTKFLSPSQIKAIRWPVIVEHPKAQQIHSYQTAAKSFEMPRGHRSD